jgi:hypothetical protein
MTNCVAILLLSTNWLGAPVATVQVHYRSPGPFALMESRDFQRWQYITSTTNDWPQRGYLWMPRDTAPRARRFYWLNTNVFTGSIPESAINRQPNK